MELEEAKNNLLEIVNLCKEDIENNNTNITAVLDYEDLKSLKLVLENSIPKEKVKKKIEEYTNYLIKGEDCTYCNNTCRNYARCMLLQKIKKELLEE